MLTYMLDTNICIYVMKNYPPNLLEKFNALAEELCISSITLGELHYGAEKSARRVDNLAAIQHFVARLDVLAFEAKAVARTTDRSGRNWNVRERPAPRTICRLAVTPVAKG
jgi:tRNA(fMet)-specific endonuclease VapC